jgi:putative intracellular protease/amidase
MSDPKTVIVFAIYPGVTHLDFTGPHQVLVRAPGAEVIVASKGGQDIEAEGLTFTKLADISKIERCDVLCVPGGFGTIAAMADEGFMADIRRLGLAAKYVTSVCTGSLILGAAGLLVGKRAACHWAWRELLTPFGAIVDESRVARDGNIITGGGVTAGIDFGLTLLAELAGDDYAQAVQLGLEYAPEPPFVGGRPELAPAHILDTVRARMDTGAEGRREGVLAAADRLKALA